MRIGWLLGLLLLLAVPPGCGPTVKVEPIEVKPVHIKLDVNVRVKVEKELEEAFGFEPVEDDAPAPEKTPDAETTKKTPKADS